MLHEAKTERFQLMIEPSAIQNIDNWRFSQRIASRAEAIRRLIEIGLNQETKGPVGIAVPPSHELDPTPEGKTNEQT